MLGIYPNKKYLTLFGTWGIVPWRIKHNMHLYKGDLQWLTMRL